LHPSSKVSSTQGLPIKMHPSKLPVKQGQGGQQ
jgi:hypothetical protein